MSALEVFPGDLAVLSETFRSGIWLRKFPGDIDTREELRVRRDLFLVLEVMESDLWPGDPALRVMSTVGVVGWTYLSRLKLLKWG